MDKKNKLILQMGVFFILVVGMFSYIVLNEKMYEILIPKVEEKLNKYIDKEFAKDKADLNIGKIKYIMDDKSYRIKLSNNKNNNLYFYVVYKKKKITNTYKKDYLEGNSIYNYTKKQYEKKFKNSSLDFIKSLDKYPTTFYEQVLNDDIKALPIYNIKTEISMDNHLPNTITKSINTFYNKNKTLGYNPKEYEIIIIDKNDINFSVKIYNLTEKLITSSLNEIINGIINKDKNIINKYNIKYEYI